MSEKIQFTDRYQALGIPYPKPGEMCDGQCEGTGWVPVHRDDPNDAEGPWHDLWEGAEIVKPTDDDYHFVKCPTCGGTGKETPNADQA